MKLESRFKFFIQRKCPVAENTSEDNDRSNYCCCWREISQYYDLNFNFVHSSATKLDKKRLVLPDKQETVFHFLSQHWAKSFLSDQLWITQKENLVRGDTIGIQLVWNKNRWYKPHHLFNHCPFTPMPVRKANNKCVNNENVNWYLVVGKGDHNIALPLST